MLGGAVDGGASEGAEGELRSHVHHHAASTALAHAHVLPRQQGAADGAFLREMILLLDQYSCDDVEESRSLGLLLHVIIRERRF